MKHKLKVGQQQNILNIEFAHILLNKNKYFHHTNSHTSRENNKLFFFSAATLFLFVINPLILSLMG